MTLNYYFLSRQVNLTANSGTSLITGFLDPAGVTIATLSGVDYLVVGNNNSSANSVIVVEKNPSTGKFDSSSTKTTISSVARPYGVAFCSTTNQLAVAGNTSSIVTIIDVNPSTGKFDNSSTKTTISLGGSAFGFGIAFNPVTEQLAVACYNTGTVVIIDKNSSTGKFDSSSSIFSTSTGSSPRTPFFFEGTGQLFISNSLSGSLTVLQKNPSTGKYDSSSTKSTITGFSDPYGVAAFTYDGVSQLAVGNNTTASQTIFVLDINNATGRFDNSSTKYSIPTALRPFGIIFGSQSKQIAVACANSNAISLLDRYPTVQRFNASSPKVDVAVGSTPREMVYYAAQNQVIVGNFLGGSVSVIDLTETYKDVVLLSAFSLKIPGSLPGTSQGGAVTFATNKITINQSIVFFSFLALIESAEWYYPSDFSITRTSETEITISNDVEFSGSTAAITGDFTITMGASTTLTLGTRSDYTEQFVIPSTGTIEVRNNVTLTGFTLSAGTTINRASGVTDPATVTLLSDPGVVAGVGVTIATPQKTLTFTGLPSGTEARLTQGSKTIVFESNITDGEFSYSYSVSGELIQYKFTNPGYKQIFSSLTLSATDQTIPLTFEPDPSYV